MLKLNGIFPPLPTSFNENEGLAPLKIKENIEKLSKYDLTGFLVLGSNGELVHLTDKEKITVYEIAREVIPNDKIMIAGTGGQSTRETMMLVNEAAKAGADAALVLNPFYYKGLLTSDALVYHFNSVADSSSIPILIYNMPANSGIDIDAETILKISKHENIIGLKDSGGNVTKIGTVIANVKPGFQVLAGSAGFLLPALSIGAVGGINALANIAPIQCLDIINKFASKKFEEAKFSQLKIIELNTAITRKWGVPALKYAMDYLGLYGGPARKPLLPLNNNIKLKIEKLIKKTKVNKI